VKADSGAGPARISEATVDAASDRLVEAVSDAVVARLSATVLGAVVGTVEVALVSAVSNAVAVRVLGPVSARASARVLVADVALPCAEACGGFPGLARRSNDVPRGDTMPLPVVDRHSVYPILTRSESGHIRHDNQS